jgi:hypothetical protein
LKGITLRSPGGLERLELTEMPAGDRPQLRTGRDGRCVPVRGVGSPLRQDLSRILSSAGVDSIRPIEKDPGVPCEDFIAPCFMDEKAPLAVPELNRERTLKYLECCYRRGLSWDDAKQQIQEFLQQRGVPHQGIVRQLALAKPLLQPWLD